MAGLCKPSTSDADSQTEPTEFWFESRVLLLLLVLCVSFLSLMCIALIHKNDAISAMEQKISAMEQKSVDNTYKWIGDQMEMKIQVTNLTNQVSHHVSNEKKLNGLYSQCLEEKDKMFYWEKLKKAKYASENSKCLAERNELQTLVGSVSFWKWAWPIIILATILSCSYCAGDKTIKPYTKPVQPADSDYNWWSKVETLGRK